MYRVEDKFACNEVELFLLQKRLNAILHSDSNQLNEHGYTITSVYFDDISDSHLQDTIDGNKQREKYRIRIYNGSLDVIKLEVKYKKYNRVFKRSKTITEKQMRRLLKGVCIEQDEMSLEDPITLFNIAIKERKIKPKVIVEYERKAFVFEPGNVRITLDRNLRGSFQCDMFGNSDIYCQRIKGFSNVLEVKYDEVLPGFIAQIIELGNLQQTSFSKYKLCREMNGE